MNVRAETRLGAIELGQLVARALELSFLLEVREAHPIHVQASPAGLGTGRSEKEQILAENQPIHGVARVERKGGVSTEHHHGDEHGLTTALGRQESHADDEEDQADVVAARDPTRFVDHAEEECGPERTDCDRRWPRPAQCRTEPDHAERDVQREPGDQEEIEVLRVEDVVGGDENEGLEQDEYQDGIAKRGPEEIPGDEGPILEILLLVVGRHVP